MEIVWDEEGRVLTFEVAREGNDHTRRVSHDGESDNQLRSSRHRPLALCLVKAAKGQRPR